MSLCYKEHIWIDFKARDKPVGDVYFGREMSLLNLTRILTVHCQQLWRDWVNRLSWQPGLPIAFS